MDSFKTVLIILTVFLIYCYLKNGYFKDITIFEGMNHLDFVVQEILLIYVVVLIAQFLHDHK